MKMLKLKFIYGRKCQQQRKNGVTSLIDSHLTITMSDTKKERKVTVLWLGMSWCLFIKKQEILNKLQHNQAKNYSSGLIVCLVQEFLIQCIYQMLYQYPIYTVNSLVVSIFLRL